VQGGVFDQTIIVRNVGNSPAENVHVYLRATPTGYFAALGSTPPSESLVPYGLKWSLGNIYPGEEREIRLTSRAPPPPPIGRGMAFEFQYTYDFYGITERIGKTYVLRVGAGVYITPEEQ